VETEKEEKEEKEEVEVSISCWILYAMLTLRI
jgi:hypothetical protein